ncbi:Asp23/Gls24 family envelope stress response protein [soil metagenome]
MSESSPLQSDRGNTTIQSAVVTQIAGIAAQEVEGVQMGGGTSQLVGGFLESVTGGPGGAGAGQATRGVSVEVGDEETAVDLVMVVEYGKSIPQISEAVRRNVINRVENLVGLRVTEVNISVNDVQFQEERPQLDRQKEVEQEAKEQEQQN